MGQQTRRESYSDPILSTLSHNEFHYHHHHHHHHHHSHLGQLSSLGKLSNLGSHQFELGEKGEDLTSPFIKLESLSQDDIRETAYEIFFTACRSSLGFGGRHLLLFHSNNQENETKSSHVVMSPTSKVKRALGLKMLKRSPSRRMASGGAGGVTTPSSPVRGSSPMHHSMSRPRRPMTSAEIMRQQMRVTEHNDNRLRKTLTRTLIGQVRKHACK